LVRNGDVKEMAKAILNIEKINRNKVRKYAEENFDIKKVVIKYEKIFKELK